MERTTIMIPDGLRERLRRIAQERGVSMATIVREALEREVAQQRPKPRIAGIGDSGHSDTSTLAGETRPEPRSWRSS
jgi:predicted transcriptional regulator